MLQAELAVRVETLRRERAPFVLATVVRARRPTSVRPGNAAIVLSDGTLHGFVGGVCAESSVRLHSLRAMETGDPILLRLVPDDGADARDGAEALDGAVVERNPCLSGGALEIFLEPHLPAACVVVVGGSPIAAALVTLVRASSYDCVHAPVGAEVEVTRAAAVIVASHGNGEEQVIDAALSAGVPYVALVASPTRGAAVRSDLTVPAQLAAQLHTPAGLNIGARTPVEIAISILAEMVAEHHADPDPTGSRPAHPAGAVAVEPAPSAVAVATDPVCGMRVAITDGAPRLEIEGDHFYFCCDRCRDAYAVTARENA
ncbi:MAG TPA: XdhC family protein [Solirubrobacteraceae bacterium]